MFYACEALTSLNISNFDTSKVEYMGEIFGKCSTLSLIDIRNFNILNLKEKKNLFTEIYNIIGEIYYNSNIFEEKLLNVNVLENWTKIDITKK